MHSYHLQAKGFEVSACIVMEVGLVAHPQAVDDLPDSDPSSFSPNFNWPNGDLGVAGETKRKSNHSPHCLTDSFYMLQLDGWWLQFKSLKQIVYHVNLYDALYALSHFSVHWVNSSQFDVHWNGLNQPEGLSKLKLFDICLPSSQ